MTNSPDDTIDVRAPSNRGALRPGDAVADGKYRIVRLIGSGGMGSVYEAKNTDSGRRVAIKCLRAEAIGDAQAMERMRREARAVASLEHSHVVDLYDVHSEDDNVFLVMEYLEGRTLRELFEGPLLPIHELVSLLLPVMHAVAAAHSQGCIHRDIKPDNIFLANESGRSKPVPKVLDFGICRIHTADTPDVRLTTGPLGTPLYMPLEQLRGADVDARADVYALGAVLYEGLTHRRLHDARTWYELYHQLLHDAPRPPKELRNEIPLALSRLVLWALEKNRDERIRTVNDLIRELEPFSTARGVLLESGASVDGSVVPAPCTPELQDEEAERATSTVLTAREDTRHNPAKPRRLRPLTVYLAAACAVSMLVIQLRRPARVEPPAQRTPASHIAEAQADTPPAAPAPAPADPTPLAASADAHATTPIPASAPLPSEPGRALASSSTRRATKKPRASAAVHADEPPAASPPAHDPIAARRAQIDARLEQLRRQLLECGELSTPWLRERCRESQTQEIEEREKERSLAASLSHDR